MKTRSAAALVALALAATSCGGNQLFESAEVKAVRAAIAATKAEPRGFVYEMSREGHRYLVRGVVQDDQRYLLQVSVDGVPALEEVAVDDAVAVRVLSPAGMTTMLCPVVQRGDAELNALQRRSYNALVSGRWVLDRAGAPSQQPRADGQRVYGDNPVLDALSAFAFVDAAVDQLAGGSEQVKGFVFARFDKERIDYDEEDDPLPHPEGDVVRYDLATRELPRKADLDAGNEAAVSDANLRNLAVYVEDGHVREIRDTVDMRLFVKEIEKTFGFEAPEGLTLDDRAALSLRGINSYLKRKGDPPIDQHAMAIRFVDPPPGSEVVLPKEAVAAPLDLFVDHGRSAFTGTSDDACRGSIDSQEAAGAGAADFTGGSTGSSGG